MLNTVFPLTKPKPFTVRVQSRDAFTYLKRSIWVFGWASSTDQSRQLLYRIWSFFPSMLGLFYMPNAMSIEYVQRFRSFSPSDFFSSLEIVVNAYGCTIKSVIIMKANKKFEEAQKLLDLLDERVITDAERTIVNHYVASVNLCYAVIFVAYSAYLTISWGVYLCTGFHAWRMYIPGLETDANFYLSNLIELFLMGTAVFMDHCADVTPLSYILMARCHILLLKDRLSTLHTDPEKNEKEHLMELKKCIQDHRLILDYIKILRPVFSGTIFVQFLLIGTVLGLSLIHVMFFATFVTRICVFVYIGCVCCETFPICYLCNILHHDCQELAESLFKSNWISASRAYKATMVHFLHNLQHPIVLTAGGIFIISIETNLSMMKLAFSVVTFMKQLNLDEKFK
ncbi:hypothetical protein KR018_002316 [Drosophila ironensis]|nr:hypothetical protein KR018_002316 [Drosophila ironensis]